MKYHFHARLFEGPLNDPKRDELISGEADDREEIMTHVKELVTLGFAVWVYVHDPLLRTADGNGQYRVVAEWNSRGDQLR